MTKIWIRQPLPLYKKIIAGVSGVMLVLVVWIIVTTVRNVPAKIDVKLFEEKISLNKELQDADSEYIQEYYLKNSNSGYYYLNKKTTTTQKLKIWGILKYKDVLPENSLPNPIISRNVLPHPVDIIKAFPVLIRGTDKKGFQWKKSLFIALWISLRRELISFGIVVAASLLIGIFMSCSSFSRAFFLPFLVIGTFIPVAALIPLTQAFFGIKEIQKIIFLSLGMFFVLLALIMKEMDEVDDIYLQTSYTLGFSQLQTVFLVNLPIALPRIWKHFAAVFGLGWGYIIFAEMVNQGGSDFVNGIGWLFIARKRRLQIPDMYAIFFVIISLAFIFSFLFDLAARFLFPYERKPEK